MLPGPLTASLPCRSSYCSKCPGPIGRKWVCTFTQVYCGLMACCSLREASIACVGLTGFGAALAPHPFLS